MLKKNYENSVNAYIKDFERKFEIKFDFWVGDTVGEVCSFGDYTFNFSDIKYVIDNDISFKWLIDWYDYAVEYQKCYYNLNSYCKLRKDEERSEYFKLDNFEKKLIYMRLKK